MRKNKAYVSEEHFDETMTAIKTEFDLIHEEMSGLKKEVAMLKSVQERTLQIVESIDQQFKEWKDIPRRVAKLESDVFELKVKAQ